MINDDHISENSKNSEYKIEDCVFCKIVKGEIPCDKLFEDDDLLALLDIGPMNPGHSLVITKKHYESVLDTPDEIVSKIGILCKKLAKTMIIDQNGGANIHSNIKQPGGQLVMHTHFHVIPRHAGDGHVFDWTPNKYTSDEEKEQYRKCISEALKKL